LQNKGKGQVRGEEIYQPRGLAGKRDHPLYCVKKESIIAAN